MYARLYGKVKTNRKIDFDKGFYFSPGGYEIISGGDVIHFDFGDTEAGTDETRKAIVYEQRYFDEAYSGMSANRFCETLLNNGVDSVVEFFLYTGDAGDKEYKVTDVLYAGIVVVDDDEEEHEFNITDSARMALYVERD